MDDDFEEIVGSEDDKIIQKENAGLKEMLELTRAENSELKKLVQQCDDQSILRADLKKEEEKVKKISLEALKLGKHLIQLQNVIEKMENDKKDLKEPSNLVDQKVKKLQEENKILKEKQHNQTAKLKFLQDIIEKQQNKIKEQSSKFQEITKKNMQLQIQLQKASKNSHEYDYQELTDKNLIKMYKKQNLQLQSKIKELEFKLSNLQQFNKDIASKFTQSKQLSSFFQIQSEQLETQVAKLKSLGSPKHYLRNHFNEIHSKLLTSNQTQKDIFQKIVKEKKALSQLIEQICLDFKCKN